MKLQARELQQEHIMALASRVQPMQYESAQVSASETHWCETVKKHGPQVTIMNGDRVVACGGLIDFASTGRSVAWALIAANSKRDFVALFRAGLAFLEMNPRRRIEAYIDPNHDAARRMMELAGFRYEGFMYSFEADGADRELWARILK